MTTYRLSRHPLSAAFGDMSQDEYLELVESIRADGLLNPTIKILEDQGSMKVLDGWHRYRAAFDAGRASLLSISRYSGTDPVGFVLDANARRRQMSASQRAAAVLACHEWANTGRPEKQNKEPGTGAGFPATVGEMARQAEVSPRTIQDAKTGIAAGLGDEIASGRMSAKQAAQAARESGDEPQPKPRPRLSVSARLAKAEATLVELRAALDLDKQVLVDENVALKQQVRAEKERADEMEMIARRMGWSGQDAHDDSGVWPDWYSTLYAIPGFRIPLPQCQAWLDKREISADRAEETAYALKSKWPGPRSKPYRDPWATFQNWVKRPPLRGQKPLADRIMDMDRDQPALRQVESVGGE